MDKYTQDFEILSTIKNQINTVKTIIEALEEADSIILAQEFAHRDIKDKKIFSVIKECLDLQIPIFKKEFFNNKNYSKDNENTVSIILNYWYSEKDVRPYQNIIIDLLDDKKQISKLVNYLFRKVVNYQNIKILKESDYRDEIVEIIKDINIENVIETDLNPLKVFSESFNKYKLTKDIFIKCNFKKGLLKSFGLDFTRLLEVQSFGVSTYIPEQTLYNAKLFLKTLINDYSYSLNDSNFYKDILQNNIDNYIDKNLDVYFSEEYSIYSIGFSKEPLASETFFKLLEHTFDYLNENQSKEFEESLSYSRFRTKKANENNDLLKNTFDKFKLYTKLLDLENKSKTDNKKIKI